MDLQPPIGAANGGSDPSPGRTARLRSVAPLVGVVRQRSRRRELQARPEAEIVPVRPQDRPSVAGGDLDHSETRPDQIAPAPPSAVVNQSVAVLRRRRRPRRHDVPPVGPDRRPLVVVDRPPGERQVERIRPGPGPGRRRPDHPQACQHSPPRPPIRSLHGNLAYHPRDHCMTTVPNRSDPPRDPARLGVPNPGGPDWCHRTPALGIMICGRPGCPGRGHCRNEEKTTGSPVWTGQMAWTAAIDAAAGAMLGATRATPPNEATGGVIDSGIRRSGTFSGAGSGSGAAI